MNYNRLVRPVSISRDILSVLLFFVLNSSMAQVDSIPSQNPDWAQYETMDISILTADGNYDLPSSFGHTNIRFKDLSRELDVTMNFGAYEFGGSNFYFDFLLGNVKYNIKQQRWSYFFRRAKKEDRNLYEQILDLSNEDKYNLIQRIENYFQDGSEYKYDYFYKNCTTLIRDLIEDNQKEKIVYPSIQSDISHRTLLDISLAHKLWTKLGLDLMLGEKSDLVTTQHEHMFLPRFYMDYLDEATVKGKRLVKEKKILLTGTPRKAESFVNKPSFYGYLLFVVEILLLLFFIFKGDRKFMRVYDRIWFIIWGGFSLFLLLLWTIGDYRSMDNNWNILWTNPLLLWLAFASLINKSKITKSIYGIELLSVLICLIAWNWIPQRFNIAFIPLFLVFITKYIRGLWPDIYALIKKNR